MTLNPKTIVVTGGTRGIGRGLAEEFLKRGCNAAVCGMAYPVQGNNAVSSRAI